MSEPTINQADLEAFYARPDELCLADPEGERMHAALLCWLESGAIRAAEPDAASENGWRVNSWVKRAILMGFKRSQVVPMDGCSALPAFDKAGYPPRRFELGDGVRVVPGGTSVRRGSHVAKGVVVMPPAYVNVGAYVGAGTMVDSHALVGSCAQIGQRVHLSAAAQIGGVLEPAGARPVIVEDEAFIGGLVGLFEGVIVRRGAVLAPGVTLTSSTVIFDLVHGAELHGEVPAGAVVVPGTRPARGDFAASKGLSLSAPMIVKYKDAKTTAATALEEALR
ncbi:MAG: 2,3,4,5-tetrahydropyridine-2,6-dicarboxylate N-succinyltransferase [Planctomycetota bacterium]